jgi:hypothetical protein
MAALAVVLIVVVLGAVAVSAVVRPAASPTPIALASPSSAAAVASPPPAAPSSSAASSPAASVPTPTLTASPAPALVASPPTGREPGVPDPRLTPGAVNPAVTPANLRKTICAKGWTATVRPASSYTTALKRQQIAQYGYTDTALAHYEEDHLVSLELGGDPRDPANLWPEPYSATLPDGTPVGARVKDQL